MWSVVAVLAAAFASSTIAVAPCSKYPHIISQLSKFSECYVNKEPPKYLAGYGKESTAVYISNDVLPANVQCLTGTQEPGYGYVDLTFTNRDPQHVTYKQEIKDKFILETDPQGIHYKIWTIRNQHHCYFYFRCIADEGQPGTGQPMAAIYVECGYEKDPEALKEIATAQKCAAKLGITNLEPKTPCQCKSPYSSAPGVIH